MWFVECSCLCSRENHNSTGRKYLKHPGAGFIFIAMSETKEVLQTRVVC